MGIFKEGKGPASVRTTVLNIKTGQEALKTAHKASQTAENCET